MSCKEWKKVRLGDVCVIRRGSSPRPILNYIGASGMPWIKISDATESNSRYIESTNQYIKESGVDKSVIVQDGDLILSNSGTAGLPKFVKITACIHDGWQVFTKLKGIDRNFLYYLLLFSRRELLHGAYDSTMKNLTLDMLRDLEINIPNIYEQKRIAAILGALDDKIELNNKINKNLEEQASALFKHWFVDFEFPDANGKPYKSSGGAFKDSELGLIPVGWSIEILSSIAEITMGQSPIGESYNLNNEGEVFYQGRADFGNRFPTRRLFTTMPNRMAVKNSVLMSVRAPVGDINIATERCCIGRGLASLNAYNNQNSYLLYLMHSLKGVLDKYNGEGTVFGSINKSTLENISILQPSDEIAQQFETVVSKLDRQILMHFKENIALVSIRDSLLPKLLKGEIFKNGDGN